MDILHWLIIRASHYLKHYLNPNAMSLMVWGPVCDLAIGNSTCKTNWSFQLQKKSQNKSKKETWGKTGRLFSMAENTFHCYLQTEIYFSAILSWVTLNHEGQIYLKHWYLWFKRVIISKQVRFKNISQMLISYQRCKMYV